MTNPFANSTSMIISDELLFHYRRCSRRAFLDLYGAKNQRLPDKDFALKLREEKEFHCQRVIAENGLNPNKPREILIEEDDEQLILLTEKLMRQGVESIYQGMVSWNLIDGEVGKITFTTSPTLLIRQNIPSELGDWSYYPMNVYMGKNLKTEYRLLTAFSVDILNQLQGINLTRGDMALRDNRKPHPVNFKIWFPRTQEFVNECLQLLGNSNIPEVYISRTKCSFCPWYNGCYDTAKSSQHLSLIPGMTPKRYDYLRQIGIKDIETLSQTVITELTPVFTKDIAERILQQSQALVSRQAIVKYPNLLPIPNNNIELYFDIEANGNLQLHNTKEDLENNPRGDVKNNTKGDRISVKMKEYTLDYLLGILLVDKEENKQEYYSFLAKNPEEEKIIWQQFLEFINQYPEAPIFHYSEYELDTIRRLAHLYKTPFSQLQSLLPRLFDLHKILINSFYLPVENYSLKTIANWLNFTWRDPLTGKPFSCPSNIGGEQCVFWYDQWLKTRDSIWLEYILIYNEDDCQGTYELKKWIEKYNLDR